MEMKSPTIPISSGRIGLPDTIFYENIKHNMLSERQV